jgi:tetratricopeptide (TPR) repeat protein
MKAIMSWIFLTFVFAVLISASAHAALPSDCFQSSYPARVIPACTEILGQDPNNGVAYFKRGKAYLDYRTDTRDLDRAIADLTKAIEIDPEYADAYNQRGITFGRNGDFARAIADQSKAIEINPAFALAYNSRGYTNQQQKDYDRALADYNKAIELDPAYAVTYFNRAFVHVLKDDTNRAITDLKQAIVLGGRDFDYVFDTLKPTEHSEVVALFTKAIEHNAKDAIAYYDRGLAYAAVDKRERAIEDYSKAIEIDPMYVDALIARGKAYSSESFDDARAMADYNKVIELDPKSARAYLARGSFYIEQIPDQADRAMADYNRAIELDPAYAYAYLQRGFLHALNNQHALAKACFAKALEIEWRLWGAIKGLYPQYLDEIEAERRARPQ